MTMFTLIIIMFSFMVGLPSVSPETKYSFNFVKDAICLVAS